MQLIHAHSRAAAWSGWYAARRCGIPFVTTFHGVYRGSTRFLKRRYNGIMAQGDRVIAVSEHVAAHIRERYGVAADRLRVIPRGIDLDAFAAERSPGSGSRAWPGAGTCRRAPREVSRS